MKEDMVKSVLFSASLHGIVLVYCFILPAQKIMPMFQAGNSALTLTSLSVSMPDKEWSKTSQSSAERESELKIKSDETNNRDDVSDKTEEESNPDDFSVVTEKESLPTSAPKHKNQKMSVDADARTKGVSAGLSESAGIRPYYPLGARLRGEEGIVKVEVWIGSNGQVLDCAVVKSSGYPTLDNAALKAVKLAHFISAKSQAIKNQSKTVLAFRFALVD